MQLGLLRADRWPTILLCKVQVFQHFEKITLLLYNKVLKLGKPVSINTAVKLSKTLKTKKTILHTYCISFISTEIFTFFKNVNVISCH